MNTTTQTDSQSDQTYAFEKEALKAYRGGSIVDEEADKMIARLGMRDLMSGPLGELAPLLNEFIVQVHLNISWYQAALKKELRSRRWFFAVSIAMLILVPILVLKLPTLLATPAGNSQGPSTTAQDVTAQVTAILTGLLGIQRAVSAWLDKRKVAGSYAQTNAKLKSLVWDLHQKWDDREIVPALKGELANDLRTAIRDARKATNEEQAFFFANLSYPTIDVGAVLKSSGASAGSIVQAHTAPGLAVQEKRNELQAEINTAQALMAEFNELIERKQDEYRDAVAKSDKGAIKRVNKELQTLYGKLNAAELDHAAAVSRLAGLA